MTDYSFCLKRFRFLFLPSFSNHESIECTHTRANLMAIFLQIEGKVSLKKWACQIRRTLSWRDARTFIVCAGFDLCRTTFQSCNYIWVPFYVPEMFRVWASECDGEMCVNVLEFFSIERKLYFSSFDESCVTERKFFCVESRRPLMEIVYRKIHTKKLFIERSGTDFFLRG